jgi:hypothetical protein
MQKIFAKFPCISTKDRLFLDQLDQTGDVGAIVLKFLNNIKSASIADLFHSLRKHTNVSEIIIDSADLSCHNFSHWFDFDCLSHLTLSHCELKDFDVEALLFQFPFQLKLLDLSFNHLTPKSLKTITNYIKMKKQPLDSLSLSANQKLFVSNHSYYPLSFVQNAEHNGYVWCHSLTFTDVINDFFQSLCHVKIINLTKTDFNFQLCKLLSQSLRTSDVVRDLNLSQNQNINDLCCHFLKDITNLFRLNLSHCTITDIGFFNLMPDLVNLCDLNVCGNMISLETTDLSQTNILRFNLKALNLGKNPIDVLKLQHLCQFFPDLRSLTLHSCKIKSSDVIVPLLNRLPLNQIILWDNLLKFNDLVQIEQVIEKTNNHNCFIDLRYNNISSKMLKSKQFSNQFDFRINNDPLVDLS